jgi:gluconolactonase
MTSRWESSAPIRYPDADIVTLDPRFASTAGGHAPIERIFIG